MRKNLVGGLGMILLLVMVCPSLGAQSSDPVPPHLMTERPQSMAILPPEAGEPRIQEPHAFWDRKNVSLHGANLVFQSLDYASTRRLIKQGYDEMNPMARPFAGNDAAMAAYSFGVGFGGTLAASYFLHRKGRHRWERLVPAIVVGTTATAVGLNFRF